MYNLSFIFVHLLFRFNQQNNIIKLISFQKYEFSYTFVLYTNKLKSTPIELCEEKKLIENIATDTITFVTDQHSDIKGKE